MELAADSDVARDVHARRLDDAVGGQPAGQPAANQARANKWPMSRRNCKHAQLKLMNLKSDPFTCNFRSNQTSAKFLPCTVGVSTASFYDITLKTH